MTASTTASTATARGEFWARTAQLAISVHSDTAPVRLVVHGEIDEVSVDELDLALVQAVRQHPRVILDLSGVGSFASGGVRVLYRHVEHLLAVLVARDSVLDRALRIAGFTVLIVERPGVGSRPETLRPKLISTITGRRVGRSGSMRAAGPRPDAHCRGGH